MPVTLASSDLGLLRELHATLDTAEDARRRSDGAVSVAQIRFAADVAGRLADLWQGSEPTYGASPASHGQDPAA
jgi:hypothetical protein